jgi:hypothetical protein
MEKTGFAYDRDIEHVGLRHVLYRRLPTPALGEAERRVAAKR